MFSVKGSSSKRSWLVYNLSLTTFKKQLNEMTIFFKNQSAVSNRPNAGLPSKKTATRSALNIKTTNNKSKNNLLF